MRFIAAITRRFLCSNLQLQLERKDYGRFIKTKSTSANSYSFWILGTNPFKNNEVLYVTFCLMLTDLFCSLVYACGNLMVAWAHVLQILFGNARRSSQLQSQKVWLLHQLFFVYVAIQEWQLASSLSIPQNIVLRHMFVYYLLGEKVNPMSNKKKM